MPENIHTTNRTNSDPIAGAAFHDGVPHELVRVSNVGEWYRFVCSCGELGRIVPDSWRAERGHRSHVTFKKKPWDKWK